MEIKHTPGPWEALIEQQAEHIKELEETVGEREALLDKFNASLESGAARIVEMEKALRSIQALHAGELETNGFNHCHEIASAALSTEHSGEAENEDSTA